MKKCNIALKAISLNQAVCQVKDYNGYMPLFYYSDLVYPQMAMLFTNSDGQPKMGIQPPLLYVLQKQTS